MIRNNITEVAYNVQSTADARHNIPIDYKVTNENNTKAMGNMVQRAKSILRTNDFTALYDKGFHTGSELKTGQDLGIETIVAIPGVPSTSQAPDPEYNYEHFAYHPSGDTYRCPQGETMRTNGSWYKERTSAGNVILFKQYKTIPSTREGFSYILTKKGIDRAGSDVGFMFIAYNFRWIGNPEYSGLSRVLSWQYKLRTFAGTCPRETKNTCANE